jgi:hypothetical protein
MIRAALACGPLSFGALLARLGRRWSTMCVALQMLMYAGEVLPGGLAGAVGAFPLPWEP